MMDGATASFVLPATPPFHLEATVRLLQRRPTNRVDLWESGHYRRVLPTHAGLRLVTVSNLGSVDAPRLRGQVCGGPVATAAVEELAATARLILGTDIDLGSRTYYAFPRPEHVVQLDIGALQSLGLNRAKALALRDLAARVLSGELATERLEVLPTEAAMEVLTALPGIGPWSAGLILLRGFRRMEVFPDGDVGAAKNLARLLNLEGPVRVRDLRPLCDGFGSVKGYLYFHALGWRLMEEGLITPARSH